MLKPDLLCESVQDIPFADLWRQGYRGLIFDLDNTLVPWHQYGENPALGLWMRDLCSRGFRVCLLSNSAYEKVAPVGRWLGIPVVCGGKKPLKTGYRRALALLEVPAQHCVMIGDQLLTDVFGAKRSGIYTVLTPRLSPREQWGTRHLSRPLERWIKKSW
ncbi:MAG: YqeG family HAD IIIA-type phosphatase [Firmicutes bacterium]|nr:YqeG family HAD IIIA-type phosphatase [Bacillota bacterium]